MSPAPPIPTVHPPDPARTPLHVLSLPVCPLLHLFAPRAAPRSPHPRLADPLCHPPALASIWGFWGPRSGRQAPTPSSWAPGVPREGDVGSWFRVGSCRRSWGEGWSSLSGCPQGPLPFLAAPAASLSLEEGTGPMSSLSSPRGIKRPSINCGPASLFCASRTWN